MQSSHELATSTQEQAPALSYVPTSISGFGRRHVGEGYGEILDQFVEDLDDH